jgi:hypothetical protein
MVGIQVFATHYLDAALSVTAFVQETSSSPAYFVYAHRADVDLLGGFWGSLARSIIEGRIRKDGPTILRHVGARLSSGSRWPRLLDMRCPAADPRRRWGSARILTRVWELSHREVAPARVCARRGHPRGRAWSLHLSGRFAHRPDVEAATIQRDGTCLCL